MKFMCAVAVALALGCPTARSQAGLPEVHVSVNHGAPEPTASVVQVSKVTLKSWVFTFSMPRARFPGMDGGINFGIHSGRRRRAPRGVQPRRAAPEEQSNPESALANERYHASVNVDVTPIVQPVADGAAEMRQVLWTGNSNLEYEMQTKDDGTRVIAIRPDMDTLQAMDEAPVELSARSNILRTTRDDRMMRMRAPNWATVSFAVFDLAGDDNHAWNLDPFEDEVTDIDLLRMLLLRFDEDPETFAVTLLELLRFMPATLEMEPGEAQRLLADLGGKAAKKMPADRLRILLEQAALTAGLERAVPADAAKWIAEDELTCIEFSVYRDLAYIKRLPKAARAYALTRTLSHSVDPRYNDEMLREIDSGAVVFDEAKAPKLLTRMRAEQENRNPMTLVPLAALALVGLITALMTGRRIAGRLLFN